MLIEGRRGEDRSEEEEENRAEEIRGLPHLHCFLDASEVKNGFPLKNRARTTFSSPFSSTRAPEVSTGVFGPPLEKLQALLCLNPARGRRRVGAVDRNLIGRPDLPRTASGVTAR